MRSFCSSFPVQLHRFLRNAAAAAAAASGGAAAAFLRLTFSS